MVSCFNPKFVFVFIYLFVYLKCYPTTCSPPTQIRSGYIQTQKIITIHDLKQILAITLILLYVLIKIGVILYSRVRFVTFNKNLNLLKKNVISKISHDWYHSLILLFLIDNPNYLIVLVVVNETFFLNQYF